MPGKMARSDPRPPCGLPEVLVAVRTSRLPSRNAGKAPIFTPVPGHPANPGQISPSAAVRAARGGSSRPRRHPSLPERGESAKIHIISGVIWGIPDYRRGRNWLMTIRKEIRSR
jgi:hypothetical protein